VQSSTQAQPKLDQREVSMRKGEQSQKCYEKKNLFDDEAANEIRFEDFPDNAGLYVPTSFSKPARFMIISVDRRRWAYFFSRNSLSTRVTVSRDVPIS
jgi:hypothetical protein